MARHARAAATAAAVFAALKACDSFSASAFVQSGGVPDVSLERSSVTQPGWLSRPALQQAPIPAARSSSFAAGWQAVAGIALLCAASVARRSTTACRAFRPMEDLEYVEDEEWFYGMPKKPNPQYEQRMGYRINGEPGKPGSPHYWTEKIRWCHRFKTRIHIRRKVEGNTARPRLAVFRSKEHMHVNVIDDTIGTGKTLACSTTRQKHNKEEIKKVDEKSEKFRSWTMEAAEVVGRDIAKKCLDANITQVVFDRGGFPYQGRVKALAEAARSAGLQF
eukprot:TRINITY_DN738_c0_g2_i2.p1 TRINITY_DN738_c0_g2~~TRINITY_DN738_c0_g2_i2.p1  ORF type:complete len:303 (-),score=76.54 TRINITY_DN738_c0_g2_i2:253-1083(-)